MGFKRTIEDFTCAHCGAHVEGNGYTNHCSRCLWSKHVDISPGDRAEACGGMMRPMALEGSSPAYRIAHECTRCGARRRVDAAADNLPETLIALANNRGTMSS